MRAEVDAVTAEQERRGQSFDSKAGFLLGLSGVLIGLAAPHPNVLRIIGQIVAALAAAASIAAMVVALLVAGTVLAYGGWGGIMTQSTIRASGEHAGQVRPVPPFLPDPDLIGNVEGNKRLQKKDRESARKFLREREHSQQ